jgi:hypothetical protein
VLGPFDMRASILVVTALLASCANAPTISDLLPFGRSTEPRVRTGPVEQSDYNDQAAGWETMRPAEGTPVLYGRDGSPVGTSPTGEVVESPAPLNPGVQENGGSRGVILDLYGELKNDHEELLAEFDAVVEENDAATKTMSQQTARIAELERQVATLTQRNSELEASELELAGRLAQSQIGRLEAERALLEASLEWRRMNAANTRATTTPEEPRR